MACERDELAKVSDTVPTLGDQFDDSVVLRPTLRRSTYRRSAGSWSARFWENPVGGQRCHDPSAGYAKEFFRAYTERRAPSEIFDEYDVRYVVVSSDDDVRR